MWRRCVLVLAVLYCVVCAVLLCCCYMLLVGLSINRLYSSVLVLVIS